MDDMDYLRMLEDEHKRILNCAAQGTSSTGRRSVCKRHLSRVLDVMEELKASHGAYFE
jgi:hypothetical protein